VHALHDELCSDGTQRLVVAHGECATTGATEIIATALSWI
jgi:hypothetical protein